MEWNDYKERIKNALDIFQFDRKILDVIKNSVKNSQKVFVAGNGGSASLALHYVCDLSKNANPDWKNNKKRIKAICLAANIGYMTAIANDNSYDEVFSQQLVNLASKKDILILISSSGNSPNIVRAAELGKEIEMIVIGITGFKGGKLKSICDYSAHLEYDSYEVSEDIHSIFGHFMVCFLKENLKL